MAQAGSSLQNYNNDLVTCIEVPRAPHAKPPAPRTPLTKRATCIGVLSAACQRPALRANVHPRTHQAWRPQELREKREDLNKSVASDEEEKGAAGTRARAPAFRTPAHFPVAPSSPLAAKIQNDLRILTERLARINDNLARKVASRTE